jgi:uncharacterized protein (DUF2141 family)
VGCSTCLALVIVTAHVSAQPPARDAARATPTGTASLAGTVVTDDAEARPIRRARIAIFTADRQVGRTAITDDSGAFGFTALPAGRYMLTGMKQGYVQYSHGATRPNRPGTAIVLADGERMSRITVRMQRGSVISGVILDQNGEPFSGAGVSVMQYAYRGSGQRTLVPGGRTATTDDRGHYRIWGLGAGEYAVAATATHAATAARLDGDVVRVSDADVKRAIAELASTAQARPAGAPAAAAADAPSRTVGYAPVYYPGTFSASQATLVKVGVGEERTGVDFQLSLVTTAKVEGTVVAPDGVKRDSLVIQVIDTNPVGPMLEFLRRATTTANGNFSLSGVPPGNYTLAVRGPTPARAPGPSRASPVASQSTLWAMAEISVDGQDVSGVTLTLQPGMTLSGRIQFEGTSPPPDLSRLRVNLIAVQAPGEVNLGVAAISPDTSGAFTLVGVTPGRYRLTAAIPSPRPDTIWQLKSSTVNGRDTLDSPIDFRQSTDDAVITFTDKVSELSGLVQDSAGRPVPEYHVIVFASDKTYWTPQSRRIRSVRPSADGKYTISNLPPGEYSIAAVTDIEPGEWYDPSLLDRFSRSAIKVAIAEGEKKTQDLKLATGGR